MRTGRDYKPRVRSRNQDRSSPAGRPGDRWAPPARTPAAAARSCKRRGSPQGRQSCVLATERSSRHRRGECLPPAAALVARLRRAARSDEQRDAVASPIAIGASASHRARALGAESIRTPNESVNANEAPSTSRHHANVRADREARATGFACSYDCGEVAKLSEKCRHPRGARCTEATPPWP
jgi:hypothetical protein